MITCPVYIESRIPATVSKKVVCFSYPHKGSGAIFTEADRELLRTLTHQSAIAIANARVYYVLEETNAA